MRNILQISEGASLAIHAMVYLAIHSGGKCSTQEIADALGGSVHHLSKIMQRLAKARLVESIRGPKGGYAIAGKAKDITLMDVYEAIDGPFKRDSCLLTHKVCREDECIFGETLAKTNDMVYNHLENTTLADLVNVM